MCIRDSLKAGEAGDYRVAGGDGGGNIREGNDFIIQVDGDMTPEIIIGVGVLRGKAGIFADQPGGRVGKNLFAFLIKGQLHNVAVADTAVGVISAAAALDRLGGAGQMAALKDHRLVSLAVIGAEGQLGGCR